MNDWVDPHFNCSLTSMLTKCLYIGTPHDKRKITLLVSRAVVKRKGNVPRTRTSQDLQKCSVLTQGSKQAALHTHFIPQHCARWSSLVQWFHWGALEAQGIQHSSWMECKGSVSLGKPPPSRGTESTQCGWLAAGWGECAGGTIHWEAQIEWDKATAFTLQCSKCWFRWFAQSDCVQTLLPRDDYRIWLISVPCIISLIPLLCWAGRACTACTVPNLSQIRVTMQNVGRINAFELILKLTESLQVHRWQFYPALNIQIFSVLFPSCNNKYK